MGQKVFSLSDQDTRDFRDIKALLQARSPVKVSDIAVLRWMQQQALLILRPKPPIEVVFPFDFRKDNDDEG